MRDALRHGRLFSRWVPNLALGFGYPFFNYREPLPYMAGEALYTFGFPLPLVLGLFYALSLMAAAYGAFVLCRELFGPRAAWVGAIAYAFAPYLLVDIYRRGNLPESIALAILPWLFITFRTLIISGSRKAFIQSLVLLVSLFLTHNISALLLVPFLGSYIVYLAWLYRSHRKWRLAFVVVILAVLLTAWFWLPALLEQDMVQLHLSTSTRNNDFHYNFISWGQMLWQLPVPYDPNFLNPPMKITLGIGQGILALLGMGCALLFPRSKEQRGLILLFSLTGLGYLWMSTASAVFVWEAFPLLSFVQFPWRLVGRALLPVSLLAGSLFTDKASASQPFEQQTDYPKVIPVLLMCCVLAGLVIGSYPDMLPPKGECILNPYPGIADVSAYEQQGWLGMDPEQSYFPVWVEDHPSDTELAAAFAAGHLPERLDADALPDGTEVMSADYRILGASIRLNSPEAFRARWKGLYFPGWSLRIDGQPAPIAPENDTGLITFEVPAGEHILDLRFGSTPLRIWGIGLLCAGLVLTGVVLARYLTPGQKQDHKETAVGEYGTAIMLLAVGLLFVKYGIVDRIPTPLRQSRLREDQLPEVDIALNQQFKDGITLLGYDISETVIPGDGEVQVDLLWQADGTPKGDYRAVVLLIGPDGQSWSPAGTARPSGYEPPPPSTGWRGGQYVFDPHIVSLLPGTPPGSYQVEVVIFDKETLTPLPVLNSDGSLGESGLVLATLSVTRPIAPFSLESLGVGETADSSLCNSMKLWTVTLDRAVAAPGDIVAVRWVWEKTPSASDVGDIPPHAVLTVTDADGIIMQYWEIPFAAGWWPVESWNAGELWIGRHVVRLPGVLTGGLYHANVFMDACEQPLAVVDFTLVDLAREWAVPERIYRNQRGFRW